VSAASAPPSAGGPLLDIDAATFRARFGRGPFRVRHRLAEHPLFSLPRLVALARTLPPSSVESHAGDVPVGTHAAAAPGTGLSVEETIRRIETCRAWMVLKHVEQDPEYRALLRSCLDELAVHAEPLQIVGVYLGTKLIAENCCSG
jgi:hypothetical protein